MVPSRAPLARFSSSVTSAFGALAWTQRAVYTVMKATSSKHTRVTPVAKGCGFTWVELLVVLTIVSLLAALTIPALRNARQKAGSARCQSNLRQLSMATQSFVADNHEYPLYINPNYALGEYPEHSTEWVRALEPYGASGLLWRCPSALSATAQEASRDVTYGYNVYGLAAYVIGNVGNTCLGLGALELVIDPASAYHPVGEALVIRPSSMLAVGDGFLGWDRDVSDDTLVFGRDRAAAKLVAQNPMSAQRAAKRHGACANVSFCDGRVEALTFERLFNERGPDAVALWNRNSQGHGLR